MTPVTEPPARPHVEPIDGGWRVKENTAGTHYIDVLPMIVNTRIAWTPKADPSGYDRHWCYAGSNLETLLNTIAIALAWDGAADTEPEGWIKNGQTGERGTP